MRVSVYRPWCYDVMIRIQNEIYAHGMNCREFAQLINVDRKILTASPDNSRGLHMFNLYKIAKALNVSTDYLLGITDEREVKQ